MTVGLGGAGQPFEDDLGSPDEELYQLTLFVSGASALSARAIASVKQVCDAHLDGRFRLAVVDVYEDPAAALDTRVLATPTLVRHRPLPERKVVGNLSDPERVLLVLELPATDGVPPTDPRSPSPARW